ncbi:hypothetical protein HNQ60_004514 [Povalibacter uvarum]|uniref:Abortive phage infection protein C-terminal domain-containing protein n=1 Tax=Povalibacter uvarum TaxID=732238 RepID=A0A841HS75_9GAMM|nr:AIPR family protein [Povalibacter uvarum]MBB6095623.1 hypothetical protein [Povalibacter uvarum]
MNVADRLKKLEREIEDFAAQNPSLAPDNQFVAWFLRAYLTDSDPAALESVTGGSRDKSVDAVFIDDRAQVVYLVQAKYRRKNFGVPESRASVIDFANLASVVSDPDAAEFSSYLKGMEPNAAELLKSARQRVARKGYRVVLVFVTLAKCSDATERDARQTVRRAGGGCSIEILDGTRCLVLLQDYLDGAAPPIPTLDVPIESGPGVKVNGVLQRFDSKNNMESWVFSASGDAIAHIFEVGGRRLFARNIRGFLGEGTSVNEGMKRTLAAEPDQFFYYNNGITIICDRAEKVSHRGTDVIRVRNPQVINGQQTSRVLAEAATNRAASVLVKVIQVPRDPLKDGASFDGLVGRIVQATNWQNAIKPSDLMANDRRQLEIEKELRRRDYLYARKRQTKGELRAQVRGKKYLVINKEELAQAVAGCELDPVIARSGKDNLFVEGVYDDVFPNSKAEFYLPRYWLFKEVTKGARHAPQRGYTKWMVLGFVWDKLRGKIRRDREMLKFVEMCRCEREALLKPLGRLIGLTYVQAIAYYRANRGSGDSEQDISLFFRSKRGRDKEFLRHWATCPASYSERVDKELGRIARAIQLSP